MTPETIDAELDFLNYRACRALYPTKVVAAFFGSRAILYEARYQSELAIIAADHPGETEDRT